MQTVLLVRTKEYYSLKHLDQQVDVPFDKEWIIHLNRKVDKQTVNLESVYVLNNNNVRQDIQLRVDESGRSIIVSPPLNGYKLGETYTLILNKQLIAQNGNPIKEPILFRFTIQNDVNTFHLMNIGKVYDYYDKTSKVKSVYEFFAQSKSIIKSKQSEAIFYNYLNQLPEEDKFKQFINAVWGRSGAVVFADSLKSFMDQEFNGVIPVGPLFGDYRALREFEKNLNSSDETIEYIH